MALSAVLMAPDFSSAPTHNLLPLPPGSNREHDIKAKYERPGVCLILTMSDMGEVTDAHGVWHTLALVMQQRQICHTIIRQVSRVACVCVCARARLCRRSERVLFCGYLAVLG